MNSLKQVLIVFVGAFMLHPSNSSAQLGAPSNSRPGNATNQEESTPAESAKGQSEASVKERFAQAQPEDITNENFPEIIESFDFPNADINDVIKAISELTGRNFIIDSNVKGKITIVAPSKITVAEAYKAFLSALASLGKTVVPSGKFWKIKDSRTAQRDSIETYAGDYFPNADQMITRIVKLRYINAKKIETDLRTLPSKDGEMRAYEDTNSLIITDYGSNITRIMNIINELDVPGFEEKMAVISIRYAKAKEIANLVKQIIDDKGGSSGRFSRSSRFNRNKKSAEGGAGAESFETVIADDRTNSIIVVGNAAGIQKIRSLVRKLDFRLSPDEAGGVFVYYVRHGDAEAIEKTINGIAKESKANARKAESQTTTSRRSSSSRNEAETALAPPEPVFGGDVVITSDATTNSLIITAGKQDYEVVKKLLDKIDIPRDQVFVKVVIMEMNADDTFDYKVDFVQLDENSQGVGRAGFRSGQALTSILNPANDEGAVLAFGGGNTIKLSDAADGLEVVDLIGFINFLQRNVGANILSTPQLLALNNEEAEIEVGADVPIGRSTNTAANGTQTDSIERTNATILLKMTPFISPDSDLVRLQIEQQIKRPIASIVTATELAETAISISTRSIKTMITAENGDTVVLGGLMEDQHSERVTKVPLLGDIPILGWLFRAKNTQKVKNNLVMFITPKILRSQQDSADLLTQKINERIDFIQRYMRGNDPHGAFVDSLPRKASMDSGINSAPEEPAVETF